ncbi:MAG: RDD family protein [Demequinaceae bacterium]|nr:RDD family protein [Demequinaceae bacterium]
MSSLQDEILIGEGVRLESGSAPVTLRVGSGLIDAFMLFLVIYLLINIVEPFFFTNQALTNAIAILFLVFVFLIVPATIETLTRGQSLGRLAVGIRIIRDDGGPISFRHAFIRALLGMFEVYVSAGSIAVTVAVFSRRGKRLGDYLAGTYALRTRGGTKSLPPIRMPESLADWAAKADIRRLPDGLALTARLFLGRAQMLRPEARARLGNMIADEMSSLVAPPPPKGTHPEAFIAAVIASRRDREYEFLIRQGERSMAESDLLRRLPHGIPDVRN